MKNLLFTIIIIFSISCQKDDVVENPYQLSYPAYFPELKYPLDTNPITKAGFELGKKLFNDPRLSIDNSVACSNCHVKSVAFTDPQHNPSVGVFERSGTRNAPMIANMAFQPEFLLDGGVSHLDFVPVFAIENQREMAESLVHVVTKLNKIDEYRQEFRNAFPNLDTITSPFMLKALSQYMLLLVSDEAKYDHVLQGIAQYTQDELVGKTLFDSKCATCHSGALFTNYGFFNNGLDSSFEDFGRAKITESDSDLGKFKVPSLRNIGRTAPYMHDGRFETLEEVLNHYRFGVKDSPTLAQELRTAGQLGIELSDDEAEKIILFLNTLTDYEFISNPIF
ncbi:MAG: cytochrome c peroxidase [Saprospiraceae bacterium]